MPLATDSTLFHSIQSFSIPYGKSEYHPLHHHPATVELLLVVAGTVHCKIDGQTYIAPAGTVLFIQAGKWHEQLYAASDMQSGYRLTFCTENFKSYAELPPIIPISKIDSFNSLLMQLKQETEHPRPDSNQMAHHLINLILLHVIRSANNQESISYSNLDKTIQEIKHYMEENYTKSLSLEELATRFELNKYQLARLFKQVTGVSPLQYIISCRINTAKYLLYTSNSSVSKIASKIGYKSVTQFHGFKSRKWTVISTRSFSPMLTGLRLVGYSKHEDRSDDFIHLRALREVKRYGMR